MNSEKLKKIMPKGVKLHQRLKLRQKTYNYAKNVK